LKIITNKLIILAIILSILTISIAVVNPEPIHNFTKNMKTTIQGERNKEDIVNISSSQEKIKTYNENGILFKYPSNWSPDS